MIGLRERKTFQHLTQSRPLCSQSYEDQDETYEGADHDSRLFSSSDLASQSVFVEVWARLLATVRFRFIPSRPSSCPDLRVECFRRRGLNGADQSDI